MSLKNTLEQSFEIYAGMTIMNRAICDARDCLKPGARMSMYAQYIDNITPDKPYRKAQKSVASAMDHFYVHGDLSLYPLFARMGKPFAMRYMLEDFQGNTGTIECGNNEAASRYTEMRLSPISMRLFKNIEKNTILKWHDNYSGEEQYPSVLPSVGFYNIVNGTSGIATGISSSIPQYNLTEVNKAMIKLLWNPDISFEEIYCSPDFCTGAILLNEEEVKTSMQHGTGCACKLRSVIEYDSKDRCLIVKEIPYGVYTETIRNQLMDIIESEDNPGIERFLDQSTTKPQIKIYINKKTTPDKIIKYLYKNTSLQYHYAINMIMLDRGSVPKVFGWKEALQTHIDHEKEVYTRAYQYDLTKIKARLHIIEGLLKAISMIDEVVKTIKGASSPAIANTQLQKLLDIDKEQAKAILDIKLSRLANLEVQKLQNESNELTIKADEITAILSNENLLKKEIEKGFLEVIEKYGDARRTKVMNIEKEEDEPIEIKQLSISLTNKNNIFVSETSSLYTQKRGGVGAKFKLDSGEYVNNTFNAETTDTLLFFSQVGNYYSCAASSLNIGEKIAIETIVPIKSDEYICATTSFNKQNSKQNIIFITQNGFLKKSLLEDYNIKRSKGSKAISLVDNDKIASVMFTNNERIGILTANGHFVICDTKDINPIGRIARGRIGIKLNPNDFVVCACIIPDDTYQYISITKNGNIKRTNASEFSVTNLNTKGNKLHKIDEGDYLVEFIPISDTKEILITSNRAQLKVSIESIPELSKNAMGAKAIKLKEKDVVIGISKI